MAFRTTSAVIAALLMTTAPAMLPAQTADTTPAADAATPAADAGASTEAPAVEATPSPATEATPSPQATPAADTATASEATPAADAPAAASATSAADASATPEATPTAEATPAADAAPADGDTAAGASSTGGAPAASRDAAQVGGYYVDSMHGAWTLRCLKAPEGSDPCELYQLMKDAQGNSVSEISLIPLDGQAAAGATIVAPLETDLIAGIGLKVDAGKQLAYPFNFCAPIGCVSRVGLSQAELDAMKRGNKATVSLLPFGAPRTSKVDLDLSLSGFTAGFDALKAKTPPVAATATPPAAPAATTPAAPAATPTPTQ